MTEDTPLTTITTTAIRAALQNDGHETRQALQHLNPGQLKTIRDAADLLSITVSEVERRGQGRSVEPPARVELLAALTDEAIEAGSYAEPAPEMRREDVPRELP